MYQQAYACTFSTEICYTWESRAFIFYIYVCDGMDRYVILRTRSFSVYIFSLGKNQISIACKNIGINFADP